MPPSPLRVGCAIEVLWDVTVENSKQNVWWTATISAVESVDSSEQGGIEKWLATILYEPMFGFDSTTATVRFLSRDQLEAIENRNSTKHVRHYWRAKDASLSESRGTSQRSHEVLPVAARPIAQAAGSSGKKLGELYADLLVRVDALQNAWSAHQCLSHKQDLSPDDTAARPLLYARHKLGELLDKPLPTGSSSARMEQGNHSLAQSHLSVQVDCSFAEFAAICHVSKAKHDSAVLFSPHFPLAHTARASPKYEAKFHSFSVLCSAIGVQLAAEATESVKRVRIDRRTKAPIFVRVVGVLAQDADSSEGPMALAVGHSILPDMLPSVTIPTLYRSSRAWDPVDGIFHRPLEAKMMRPQDLVPLFRPSDAVSGSGDDEERNSHADTREGVSCFRIVWNRTTRHIDTTFVDVRPESVLGVLDVSVPCVNVRGDAICAEVDSLCSIDFIRTAE